MLTAIYLALMIYLIIGAALSVILQMRAYRSLALSATLPSRLLNLLGFILLWPLILFRWPSALAGPDAEAELNFQLFQRSLHVTAIILMTIIAGTVIAVSLHDRRSISDRIMEEVSP